MKPIDKTSLIGRRFGKLMALNYAGMVRSVNGKATYSTWKCVCDCGAFRIVLRSALIGGGAKSCLKCVRRGSRPRHGHTSRTHTTPTYYSWKSMIQRCTNPKSPEWEHYGGRGITVCKRWRKFENFLADMGVRPKGTTIDRKKNNRGYFKANCHWANRIQQASNTQKSHIIKFRGEKKTLSQWAITLGIKRPTLENRLRRGSSVTLAFTKPVKRGVV